MEAENSTTPTDNPTETCTMYFVVNSSFLLLENINNP
jgi:hypothetical protein